MLFHAWGGASRPSRGPPGASRASPGASRGLPGGSGASAPKNCIKTWLSEKMRPPRTAKASNLGEAEISRGMVRLD